jgi:hypothetical protein
MTYAQGGLIQAADYNGLVGGNPTDVAGTLNRVWAVGQNDRGYGQTAVSQVSAGATVTGPQWASLINNLNSAYRHNTNTSGTGLVAPTTGNTILFISTLSGYLTDIYNNRLTASTGSITTGSYNFSMSAAGGTAVSGQGTRTVSWSSADNARYFWNAGGSVALEVTSVTNNNGTSRSASMVTLARTNFLRKTFYARRAAARAGTGGIVNYDYTTSYGFYELTTTYRNYTRLDGNTYPYTGDYVFIRILTNGTAGSYGGNGTQITINFYCYSDSTGTSTPTADPIDVTVNYNVTAVYPSASYLSNTWGTATIA